MFYEIIFSTCTDKVEIKYTWGALDLNCLNDSLFLTFKLSNVLIVIFS